MPDSGAVYQPTTVGYTYDSGGENAGGGDGIRGAFWRLMSRHKISTRKRVEWTLLAVALCFFVAGLATMLVSLVTNDDANDTIDMSPNNSQTNATKTKHQMQTTVATMMEVEEHIENRARNSIALGAGMTLAGLLLGFIWAWLRFFRRSKSPRNGMTGSSGQYGPVLTELPSQLKLMQTNVHEVPAVPLSDQEEETRTLMQDSTVPAVVSVGGPNTVTKQIPG